MDLLKFINTLFKPSTNTAPVEIEGATNPLNQIKRGISPSTLGNRVNINGALPVPAPVLQPQPAPAQPAAVPWDPNAPTPAPYYYEGDSRFTVQNGQIGPYITRTQPYTNRKGAKDYIVRHEQLPYNKPQIPEPNFAPIATQYTGR